MFFSFQTSGLLHGNTGSGKTLSKETNLSNNHSNLFIIIGQLFAYHNDNNYHYNTIVSKLNATERVKITTIMQGMHYRAPVAQLVEHRAVMREVVSSTPAGPTLRVLK